MSEIMNQTDLLQEYMVNTPFTSNEDDNESEEDIQDSGLISVGDMTVTGTDWTTETIVRQMEKGNIMLDPDFQRRDAWTAKKKSRFIESLFMGFPIPQIILAEQKGKKGKFIVIDGKQRLLSLQQFMRVDATTEGTLRLTGLEIKKELNGLTYQKMQGSNLEDDIDALLNQPIRTVVIRNWPTVEVLYLIFLRLNTGSVKLSPQELRQALYPGKFVTYANQYASSSKSIKHMLKLKDGKTDFRMRDVEIFVRYMAFKFYAKEYTGSMQFFLDSTCDKLNSVWAEKECDIRAAASSFENADTFIRQVFVGNAYNKFKGDRYEGKLNRAIMDVLLYFFSFENIRENANGKESELCAAFEQLCSTDQHFMEAIEQTTKSISSVSYRFNKWAEVLSTCICVPVISPYKEG